MMKIYWYLLLLFLSFSCKEPPQKEISNRTLVKNIHIVDVEEGTVHENRHIVVEADRILEISDVLPAGEFSTVIDGQGAYVVPGLTEMHAHIPSPPTSSDRIEETLFLYLSGGITTIRGMLGHPYHLE